MTPDIFPDQSEFFHQAAEATAKRQNCPVILVYDCMYGLDAIWNRPDHLEAVKDVTMHMNDAARFAKQLHRALTLMTAAQRQDLTVAGCVTVFQVEHLADVLASDARTLKDWSRTRIRTGGRNPAAYDIAEMMRRIFRRQRKKITYGTEANSDLPSTDFGKAVRYALGDFGVTAGWRMPARKARDDQNDIENRLRSICEARRLRKATNTKSAPLI